MRDDQSYGVIEYAGRDGWIYETVSVHERNVRGDTVEYGGQCATIVAIFSDRLEARGWAKARNAE